MEADEFFTSDVAHSFRATRVSIVPGIVYGGGDEVDPPPIGDAQGQGFAQRSGGDVDGVFVEVNKNIGVAVLLLQEEGVGRADDVGFCAVIGKNIELLEWSVGTEKTPLWCIGLAGS